MGSSTTEPTMLDPSCYFIDTINTEGSSTTELTMLDPSCDFTDTIITEIQTYPKLNVPNEVSHMRSDRGGKRLLLILLTLLWGMEIGFKFASRTVIYLLNPCHVTTLIQIQTYPKLNVPNEVSHMRSDRGGKRLLLILLTLLWGMEIGFKFASRTVIYLLNPCHVTTLIQIYLLSAPPSKTVTTMFRIHLNLLNGPLLAFLFPETASRKIFAEAALYWIQHGMMFVIPYYLLRIGGVYNVEPLKDFSWSIFSYCLNLLYHFIVLQVIAIPAQVNLNHMLCPAILDPFEGPWYRIAAVLHQALLCPILCKLYCLLADFCLTKFPPTKIKIQMKDHLMDKIIYTALNEKPLENTHHD